VNTDLYRDNLLTLM